MVDLSKVANVLDATADHFEALEREKISSATAERQAMVDILAEKYAEATGEEMPSNIRQKLAESDKDVVELLRSMVAKQAGDIEPLGGPAHRSDETEPQNTKEAAEAADDRFLKWINS